MCLCQCVNLTLANSSASVRCHRYHIQLQCAPTVGAGCMWAELPVPLCRSNQLLVQVGEVEGQTAQPTVSIYQMIISEPI